MASLDSVEQWATEVDVLVLGCGLAGMTAALEASDSDPDATVLILEKTTESESGGNSRVSGQSLSFPNGTDAYRRYQEALNEPHPIPSHLMSAWVAGRSGQKDWVQSKAREAGFELATWGDFGAEFPSMPGSGCIEDLYTLRPADGSGDGSIPRLDRPHPSGVYLCFKKLVDRADRIEVLYQTAARDLVYHPDSGEVFGVVADQNGQSVAIKARRAVIIATGGFEADPEKLATYAGYTADVVPYGSPHNTGDAIAMLQRAGAKLWHMRNFTETGGIHPGIKPPGLAPMIRNPRPSATSWIDVGKNGKRFYPEAAQYHDTHFKHQLNGQWQDIPTARVMPVHMIFDEKTRSAEKLVAGGLTWAAIVEGYEWSDDNLAEIGRGWIQKADTIRELATMIGRDQDALESEVEQFNEYARAGLDPLFGRHADTMSPIEQSPFYAVAIVPGLICTTGGAMRNERGQVLDENERPIPRLYEAGELGSFHSNLYQNGSFLTEAMFSGRSAGSNAAREKPWAETSTASRPFAPAV